MKNHKNLLFCMLGSFVLSQINRPYIFQYTYALFRGWEEGFLFREFLYKIFDFASLIGYLLLLMFIILLIINNIVNK